MLRVVLDTNVLISAIVFGGKPRQILDLAIRGEIQLCISDPILDEIRGVLRRSKFGYSPEMIQVILTELTAVADFVNSLKAIEVVSQYPADNRIIECAVEAGASYIVTGDTHLLKISRYGSIEIVNAVAFLEKLSCDT